MPIEECGEPMLPIPGGDFAFFDPHPYIAFGAPYGAASPWMLRKGVIEALQRAQTRLQDFRPGWKIMLFDAYRPNAVQHFMVEKEFATQAKKAGWVYEQLTPEQRGDLGKVVFRYWAIPSEDPATPPLHSTGAVVDITLADEAGKEVAMGSPIDEISDRSTPDHFATATDEAGKQAHKNRQILKNIMFAEGFCQMSSEWWHFSLHDQYWAWQQRESGQNPNAVALYGRVDLL